jgi:hypothetical protein
VRTLRVIGIIACLAASGAAWPEAIATVLTPTPEDAAVTSGVFTSAYFDLEYPLPRGWTEAQAGSPPSSSGYYVLGTLTPADDFTAMMLITAQDMFFAGGVQSSRAAAVEQFRVAMSAVEGMTIDRSPEDVEIAGRSFSRIDFSGVGLFRSMLVTEIRCHLVAFTLTANNPARLAELVSSLNKLGSPAKAAPTNPICVRNYVDIGRLLERVDPPPIGPAPTTIPIRIIIGPNGAVEHVHVIRGTAQQRKGIEDALSKWKVTPPGEGTRIETGVLVEFTTNGGVRYRTSL